MSGQAGELSLKKFRRAKRCEVPLQAGSPECFYLNLARSRWLLAILRAAMDLGAEPAESARGETPYRIQITVQCPVCRRVKQWFAAGWTSSQVQWWLRNMAPKPTDATSIIWQMVVQPTVQERSIAFAALKPGLEDISTKAEAQQMLTGSRTTAKSNTVVSFDQDGLPTTS